ncbi:MAG: helix-turn-helix transcriptional regulator [Syntrophobacteraceae bacterium]
MKSVAEREFDLAELEKELPVIFGRAEIRRLLGGVLSPGYLANLDSKGEGPPRIRIGARRVGYPRGPFIAWLKARSQAITSNQGQEA